MGQNFVEGATFLDFSSLIVAEFEENSKRHDVHYRFIPILKLALDA